MVLEQILLHLQLYCLQMDIVICRYDRFFLQKHLLEYALSLFHRSYVVVEFTISRLTSIFKSCIVFKDLFSEDNRDNVPD